MTEISYNPNPGTSSLRGKQHWACVDADIRRTAEAFRQAKRDEQAQQAQAQTTPVDPTALKGAVAVRDRRGMWHEVVRVNKTTVSVKTAYSWVDKIPHAKIVEVR